MSSTRDFLLQEGDSYYLHKNYEKALEYYNQILKIDPKDIDAICNKFNALEKLGSNDNFFTFNKIIKEVIVFYDKALEINPKDVSVLYLKCIALGFLGRFAEALEILDKCLEINPKDVDALTNKGLILVQLGKGGRAMTYFEKALEIDPKCVEVLYNKCWAREIIAVPIMLVLNNLGRYDEALEYCDKSLEINPKDVDALGIKGITLANMTRYQEAITYYDKALEIVPKNSWLLENKNLALYKLGEFDTAIEYRDHGHAVIDPKNVNALFDKGITFHKQGRYAESLTCWNEILDIEPKNVGALGNKGSALAILGKYAEAIECYDKVLEMDSRNVIALRSKGNALFDLGKYDDALELYEESLEIDPTNVNAIISIGSTLANLGKHEQALEWYDKALKIDPEDFSSLYNKGTALAHLGRDEEAIEWYDKALKIDPNDVWTLGNKALAFDDLGKHELAIEWFDKVLAIEPTNAFALTNKNIALDKLGNSHYSLRRILQIKGKVVDVEITLQSQSTREPSASWNYGTDKKIGSSSGNGYLITISLQKRSESLMKEIDVILEQHGFSGLLVNFKNHKSFRSSSNPNTRESTQFLDQICEDLERNIVNKNKSKIFGFANKFIRIQTETTEKEQNNTQEKIRSSSPVDSSEQNDEIKEKSPEIDNSNDVETEIVAENHEVPERTIEKTNCIACGKKVDFSSGKKCKYCGEHCCFEHLLDVYHNCIMTRYVDFIKKDGVLRRKGRNIMGGKYIVVCDQCGYRSKYSNRIDFAGTELENHLHSKGCDEKKVFLKQTNEDEIDKVLGRPEQSSGNELSWMNECLEKAKEIIITYHKEKPTDTNYLDCKSFLTKKTFEIDIQKTRGYAYGYINLYEDFKSQNHYQIGIHEILSEDTPDNRGMVTVVLIHEILHALHPLLEHNESEGINYHEKKLANLGLHYDAIINLQRLYLSGKMHLCSK